MTINPQSQRFFLKDYKAPNFQIQSVKLWFNLLENKTQVRSEMNIIKTSDESVFLNGVDLKLISISLNGSPIQPGKDYTLSSEGLLLHSSEKQISLIIETEINPEANTSLEGLYLSNGIFTTQCEAQGFRKITFFPDRPDVMTSFEVFIEADEKKYPVLLSNGDRLATQKTGHGRHEAHWKDPHKKPCYLFALVAGDLSVISDSWTTASGKKVLLEVFAPHGKQERCHHAMKSLKKSMQWDEQRFGREYDLNNYMIVAIDDFNAGAMENKGLNIFNSRLVLADPQTATDSDYHAIESVVAHEYFHNWTGNRITLRDWFQLSLKEGLTVFRDQEFSADMTDRGLQRIIDVDSLRERQFPEDASPNAHPVRPESCLSVDNFFTPTIYEKGAEVIRMMQILTGRKGFRKGMDLYFSKFDGKAVTTDDFANAISEANNLDFSQFKLWYEQPGTPLVQVQEKYDAVEQKYFLTLSQKCYSKNTHYTSDRPFHIPVLFGLIDSSGQEIELQNQKIDFNSDGEAVLHLKEKSYTWVFNNLKEKPIPSLFREFSAPINLHWETSEENLLNLLRFDRDGFNRREMAQKLLTETFLRQISNLEKGENSACVSDKLILALRDILHDAKLAPGFKAKILTLPSDVWITQRLSVINAPLLKRARNVIQNTIAMALQVDFEQAYLQLHKGANLSEISHKNAAERELKNTILGYLSAIDNSNSNFASKQFFTAKLMTEKMSALKILLDCSHKDSQTALDKFEDEFKQDPLVMNKWFQIQAAASSEKLLRKIQDLCKHPSFNIQNPNNVYSLLRTYGQNIVCFHDPQENAYDFYVQKISEIDAKNPQVAARLCNNLNIVGKLPENSQTQLRLLIRQLLNNSKLSPNSRELLEGL